MLAGPVLVSDCRLVGREREMAALTRALGRLAGGEAAFVEMAGEPGIGKTRLLGELAAEAGRRGHLVLGGRATEFERDAPYGLWVDAVDPYLRSLDGRRLRRLGGGELEPLAVVLPAFAELAAGGWAPQAERYVVQRAMRALLERLAALRPLVLCLDDVHWADAASLELVAALARRRPERAVLVAVAYREGQAPDVLVAALGDAVRAAQGERLALGPLTFAEAAALCGGAVDAVRYELSGGNPFYLQQLGRAPAAPGRSGAAAGIGMGAAGIPAAVAAALAGELDALTGDVRRVLEAAAVVGEPFEPDVVADVASVPDVAALAAFDVLLERALIRPTGTPRRFAFRHPLVRHAVYAAAPGAWRLRAHGRAATALERRGAGAVERAHHVEQSAQRGDRAAVELLAGAAQTVSGQAPASAAGYLQSALRLLPDDTGLAPYRIELMQALAIALLGAGQLEPAHEVIADTLKLLPPEAWEPRGLLISIQTSIESWTGRAAEEPRRLLRATLSELPDQPSFAGFALRMPLAGMELFDLRLERVPDIARRAVEDARGIANPTAEAAALAMLALAHAAAGRPEEALAPVDRAVTLLDGIEDAAVAAHPQVFWNLGWTLGYLDRYEAALGQLRRGVTIGHRSGHGYFIPVLLATQVNPLIQLGRLAQAVALGEEAVDAAFTSANPQLRLGAHRELALARHLRGDAQGALREAREAVRLAGSEGRLWRAKASWTLGLLVAVSRPDEGITLMCEAAGGADLPAVVPAERPLVWTALVEAELQREDVSAAEQFLARLESAAAAIATPLVRAAAARSQAEVLLVKDRPLKAAEAAQRGATTAAESAPLEAARARATGALALSRTANRERGLAALEQAADELESFGAQRLRDQAVRELRRLGVRTWKRGPTAPRDTTGIQALSAREREIGALVLAGKRNTEIARDLFLSVKTVETHMRNLYAKLNVTSRVDLANRLRDDNDAS
jgi:DNA-binding NarL/FixJ family response regulator/tetratricopeptide (TPR) repeat protein